MSGPSAPPSFLLLSVPGLPAVKTKSSNPPFDGPPPD